MDAKLKQIESFFSSERGFDTRKVLNRSNTVISPEIINEIETDGITSERLETLGIPVFKYHTQITLHGIFNTDTTRLNGYQSLIVNQNKSLGVRYNAVDVVKKRRIYNALAMVGLAIHHSSSGWYAFKVSEPMPTKDALVGRMNEYKALVEKITMSSVIANTSVNAFRHEMFGTIHAQVVINLLAVKDCDVWPLIETLTGKTQTEIEQLEQAAREKAAAERAEQEQRWKAQADARKARETEYRAMLQAAGYVEKQVTAPGCYYRLWVGDLEQVVVYEVPGKKLLRSESQRVSGVGEFFTPVKNYSAMKFHTAKLYAK